MFQAQNREIKKVLEKLLSSEIFMLTSVTTCFTTQHKTCKTKTKTDCLVSDRFCPTTDGLRPHHCIQQLILSTTHNKHKQMLPKVKVLSFHKLL